MKYLCFLFFVLLSTFGLAQSPACNTDNHRAFDFWLGEWKVTNPKGDLAGYNSIRKIHGGCVVAENWTGAGASRGSSFNHYDSTLDKWKQKWVDNNGADIEFLGEIKNEALVTYAETVHPKTKETVFNKMTIAKIDENNVSQIWEQSADSEEWNVVFNGHYSRLMESVNSTQANAVYDSFTLAYETLNPELMRNLYQENAYYIASKDRIMQGLTAIHESFISHFQYRKEKKQTMTIAFKIINRQESDEVIADIGFYKLSVFETDQPTSYSYGKFSTVLTKDAMGNWKFNSDVYHPASELEFEEGK